MSSSPSYSGCSEFNWPSDDDFFPSDTDSNQSLLSKGKKSKQSSVKSIDSDCSSVTSIISPFSRDGDFSDVYYDDDNDVYYDIDEYESDINCDEIGKYESDINSDEIGKN